jgi:hypothetical protein
VIAVPSDPQGDRIVAVVSLGSGLLAIFFTVLAVILAENMGSADLANGLFAFSMFANACGVFSALVSFGQFPRLGFKARTYAITGAVLNAGSAGFYLWLFSRLAHLC